jgi:hypothetical protein
MSENRSYEIAKNPPNPSKVPTKVTVPTQVPQVPKVESVPKPSNKLPSILLAPFVFWEEWTRNEKKVQPQWRDELNPVTRKPYKSEDEYKQLESLKPQQKQSIATLTSTR